MSGNILVIDEGTTSTRAILFDPGGECLGFTQRELTQYYPAAGHVEHDAAEIWDKTLACLQEMVERAGGADRIAALGITNQRETVVAWDKRTGEPLARAIVWQDRRTADQCAALRKSGHEALVQAKTGLLLDPYFSGSKMAWMLENWTDVRDAGERLALGTVESYLIFRLTGGLHVTDASNASRTMLMPLDGPGWDSELLAMFGIPAASLPAIVDCAGVIGATAPGLLGGSIPICGSAGDQQAATIGQACLAMGDTKATFGTGAFVLANSGSIVPRSGHRLLATVLHQIGGKRHYALEGSVFVAGSLIKWLRDELGILASAAETATLAPTVPGNDGVYLVPALTGLGAPHWNPDARGALTGLSFATTRAHIARAALESMAYMAHDLQSAFAADRVLWQRLKIDGGMAVNDWMAQDLADILDIPVERPELVETTALGAAMLAAVGAGLYPSLEDAASMRKRVQEFRPAIDPSVRSARLKGWATALSKI
ncbi:MAG TPA: glycerol kinase [Rhizorhapis sp.]|nr:glycerol kinase [Rhizorhapis sp.]